MTDRDRHQRLRPTRPAPDVLEDRRLLSASLAPIANLTVPSQQGYALALDGSGTTDAQTFTITRISGSPDIGASIATGPFWTLDVNYTDPTDSHNDFSGPMVFQLFQGLTPNTVSQFEQYTRDNYFTQTGKYITRVATGFPGLSDYIIQGGAPNPDGSGSSNQPGTPFLNENVQQLAFTGTYQLAMANAGVNPSLPGYQKGVNTNDTQFFVTTTGSPNAGLGYGYTIFGQMVAGQDTIAKLIQIPVTYNANLNYEKSLPDYAPTFSSATMSATNPNGVALIDTTQARPGESATFQVTATDPTGGPPVTRTFTVTVGPYGGPTDPAIDFKPFAQPVAATVAEGSDTTIKLPVQAGYPDTIHQGTTVPVIVAQPGHGTISDFDPATGTLVYTPAPGFSGTDTFQYEAQETGPAPPLGFGYYGPSATTSSNPMTVTITVEPTVQQPSPPISPSPTPTSPVSTPASPSPTPVTLARVADVVNKKHLVTGINLTFSGAVDPSMANDAASYRLIRQGKHGEFSATRRATIKVKSASYDAADGVVTLVPKKPFALSKPVEVLVVGQPPWVLSASRSRLIEGDGGGRPGGEAAAVLSAGGVAPNTDSTTSAPATADAVDALIAQADAEGLARTRAAAWLGESPRRAMGPG